MNIRIDYQGKIAWGILGCAGVARHAMVPAIQGSRNGRVLGAASRNLAKAKEFADRMGIERTYGKYEELLDDSDIQAVYIPLPNSLHKEWTIRAAERGKHVLCEKPVACNTEEAREMAVACRKRGVLLMEGFAHRFQPQNILVKQIINQGRIGKVLGMTAVHSGSMPAPDDIRLNKKLGGGALMDKGCYCVNTARFVFGAEPVSVYANAEFGSENCVDERLTCTLYFPGAGVAQFDTSFRLSPGKYCQNYEVFGERGQIYVPNGFAQVETYRYGTIVDTSFFVKDNDVPSNKESEKINCGGVNQWQLEAEYFADCVLRGEKIEFPAEDGLANMRVIDAIWKSAAGRCDVNL